MRCAAAMAAAVLGLALAVPAAAQQVTLEPSAAVLCLTPAAAERGAPEYPFVAFKRGQTGRVKVALTFTTPQTRPAVDVVLQEGGDEFVDAVKQHVRDFRVPCHDGGETPVKLVFDFVFRADDRQVHWSPPVDADHAQRKAQLACIVHQSGEKAPAYPREALRNEMQGRVLVRLRYEAPDQPPVAEILPRPDVDAGPRAQRAAGLLSRPLVDWVAGYRMPCYQGKPLTTTVTFVYVIEGSAYGFKPGLTLGTLLPLVRDIRKQTLDFDFTRMGCPFDVSLQYRRPSLLNLVGEVGSQDPARRPFLDWLARADFDLPSDTLNSIYGDTTTFAVPCLKIKLQPQEPA
ncbi:MAG: hypothetical protein Q7U26_13235 [Aquabacterium sp.]|nr:hypothetical protein [Aquabacterium sp.]